MEAHSSSSCLYAGAALRSRADMSERSGSYGNSASSLGAVLENQETVSEVVNCASRFADNSQIQTNGWDGSGSVGNMMPTHFDHKCQTAVKYDQKESHSAERMNTATDLNSVIVNKDSNQPEDYTQPSPKKSKQSEQEKAVERWYCEKCGASLSTKYHLARHMRTHSEARPFQCSLCGKSYKDSSNLSLHMMNHVEETNPGILGSATSKRYKDTAKLAAVKKNEKRNDVKSVLRSGSDCVGSVSAVHVNVGGNNAAAEVFDSTASWIHPSSHSANGSGGTSQANFPTHLLSHSQDRTSNVHFSSNKQTSNSDFSVNMHSSHVNLMSDCHAVPDRTSDVNFASNVQTSDYSVYVQANATFAANLQASTSFSVQPSSINLLSETQPVLGSLASVAFVGSTETANSFDYSGQNLLSGQPVNVFEPSQQNSFQAQTSTEQDNFRTQNSSVSFTQAQLSVSWSGKKKKPKPAHNYLCSSCNASFMSKYHLERHSRKHTGVKPFRCNQCDKAFSDTSNLTHHMIIHTGEKWFECEWCGHTFAYKASLKRHMHRHLFQATESDGVSGDTGAEVATSLTVAADQKVIFGPLKKKVSAPKRYICDHCHVDFATKYHLQRHLRKHTGDKPFQCLICDKAFNDKSNMERHKLGHLKDDRKKGNKKPKNKQHSERFNKKRNNNVNDGDNQQEIHLTSAQSPDLRGCGGKMMADTPMILFPSAGEMHDLCQKRINSDFKNEDGSCYPSFAIQNINSDLNEEESEQQHPYKNRTNSGMNGEDTNDNETNRESDSDAKSEMKNENIYYRNKETLAALRHYLRTNTRAAERMDVKKRLKRNIKHGEAQPRQFKGFVKRPQKPKSTVDETQPREPQAISKKCRQQDSKYYEMHPSAKSPIHRETAIENAADQSTENARMKHFKRRIKSDNPYPPAKKAYVIFTEEDMDNANVKLADEKNENSLQNVKKNVAISVGIENSFADPEKENLPHDAGCRRDVDLSVRIKTETDCEEMVLQLNSFVQEKNDETYVGDHSCEEDDYDGNVRFEEGKEERDEGSDDGDSDSNDETEHDDNDGGMTDMEGDNVDNDNKATTMMEDDSQEGSARNVVQSGNAISEGEDGDDEKGDDNDTAGAADDSAAIVTENEDDDGRKRDLLTDCSKSKDDGNSNSEEENVRNASTAMDDIIEPGFDCGSFWQDCDMFAKRRKKRRTSAKSKLDRFICDICTARFSTKYLVKRHRRTHSDQKPFMCSECDKAFNDSSNLVRHLHNIHKFSRPAAMEIIRAVKEKVEKSPSQEKDFWWRTKTRRKITSRKIRPKVEKRRLQEKIVWSKPTMETKSESKTFFRMMVNSGAVNFSGRLRSDVGDVDDQETVSAVSLNNGRRCFRSSKNKPNNTGQTVCGDEIWMVGLNAKSEMEETVLLMNLNEDVSSSVCSGSPTHHLGHPHSTRNKPSTRRKNSQDKTSVSLNPEYEPEKAAMHRNGSTKESNEAGLNPAGVGHEEGAINMNTLTEGSMATGWNNAALCKATEMQDKMFTRFSARLRNCVNNPKRKNENDAAQLTMQKGNLRRSMTVSRATSRSEDSAAKKNKSSRTSKACHSETAPRFAFGSEMNDTRIQRKSKTRSSETESLDSGSKRSGMKGNKKRRKCSTLHSLTSEMNMNGANVCKGKMRTEQVTSVCDICCAAFTTQAALETHRLSHAGHKLFKCAECNKAFNHCGNLLRHLHQLHKYSPRKAVAHLKTMRHQLLKETHTDALAQLKVDLEPRKAQMSRHSNSNEKTNMTHDNSSNGYLRSQNGHHIHERVQSNDFTDDHLSYSVIGEYMYSSTGSAESVHGSGFREQGSKVGDDDEQPDSCRQNLSTHIVGEAQKLCTCRQNSAQGTIKMEQTDENFLQAERDCHNDIRTITNCDDTEHREHDHTGTVANHNSLDLEQNICTMVNHDSEQRQNSKMNTMMYNYNVVDKTEKDEQALRKAAICSQAQENKADKLHCRNDAPTEVDPQTMKTSGEQVHKHKNLEEILTINRVGSTASDMDSQVMKSLEGHLEQESRMSKVGSSITASLLAAACSSSPAVESRSVTVSSSSPAVSSGSPAVDSSSVCQIERRVAKSPLNRKPTLQKVKRQARGGNRTLIKGKELMKQPSSSHSVALNMQQQQWMTPRPFECYVCSSDFKDSNGLRQHMKIHSGSRPFLCTACGSSFPRNTELRRHMRTHTGERPFLCTYCGKSFADSSTLTQHVRLHTGYKPFQCPCCHLAFAQSSHMKDHWRRKHPSAADK